MNRIYGAIKQVLSTCGLGLICALFPVGPAAAQATGAIFTSTNGGEYVDANLYDSKEAVYLNGGPQNDNSPGLPDGDYYFQVTDPSGAVLLSTDPIECRQVKVWQGRVYGAAGASCQHSNGT